YWQHLNDQMELGKLNLNNTSIINASMQNTSENISYMYKYPWQYSQHPIGVFVGLYTLEGCIALGIIFTNLLMIFSFLLNKKLRTPTNIIVLNIACVDLLQGLVATPMRLVMNYEYSIAKEVVYGSVSNKYFCIIQVIMTAFPGSLTLWMFVVVSVDRYIAIQHPYKYEKLKNIGRICIIFWVLSCVQFLGAILSLQYWSTAEICSNYSSWMQGKGYIINIVIVLCTSIGSIIHIKILWIAYKHRATILSQLEAVDHSKAVAYKKGFRVLKSTITLFGFFVGMWGLYLILRALGDKVFGSNVSVLKIWHESINKLVLIISLLNPVMFAFRQPSLRKAMLKCLMFCLPESQCQRLSTIVSESTNVTPASHGDNVQMSTGSEQKG
ncbi:unnamed protein product, partial [Owenia fusiformis]